MTRKNKTFSTVIILNVMLIILVGVPVSYSKLHLLQHDVIFLIIYLCGCGYKICDMMSYYISFFFTLTLYTKYFAS